MRTAFRCLLLICALFPLSAWSLSSGVYYSPATNLEALDVQALSVAQRSIDFAAYSLTDQAIVNVLLDRAAHGVRVRIYLDQGELQAGCRADVTCAKVPLHALIGSPGVEIMVKHSKVLMHLKSYLVDGVQVRDGSANFSPAGEFRQDNSSIFSDDPRSAAAFSATFAMMWSRAENLTVAQAVQATPARPSK